MFVAVGLLTRPSVIFMIIILLDAQSMFGFNYTQGPAI
ncbi:MAG: hypothetical protein ACR2F1_05160 [Nitrososphaeraceae archaeon]